MVAVFVADGDTVAAGDRVVAVEAMKMEHSLTAPVAGTVRLHVADGDQVAAGQVLATVEPVEPDEEHGRDACADTHAGDADAKGELEGGAAAESDACSDFACSSCAHSCARNGEGEGAGARKGERGKEGTSGGQRREERRVAAGDVLAHQHVDRDCY